MALLNKLSWENYTRFSFLKKLAGYMVYLQHKFRNINPIAHFPSKADKHMFHQSFTESMNADRAESIRRGLRGVVHELKIYSSDWGFNMKDIRSNVHLYCGKDDKNVSLRMGEYYKDHIPKSTLTVYEGGHLSWIEHAEEILRELVGEY